ncbi:DUF1257 domain-containing protein [Synechococcus sp. MIT S9507]|uniref:DUF1257 domain-containing protein n=1 Tax=Synechococcus sp. MIT S9507 TaxID=3082544 RepID=UPI0039B5E35E
MSHLSILPTLVTDLDLLEIALRSEGFKVFRRGIVSSFDTHHSVDLAAVHPSGLQLGWRQSDDQPHFDLVADLAAPEGSGQTESALRRVLRRYAMNQAMRHAEILDAETVTAGS